MRVALVVCASLAIVSQVFIPSAARAADPGSLCAYVSDSATSAPVADARIFLLGTARGESLSAVTTPSGEACFASLREAQYRLSVEHKGFTTYRTSVSVTSDDVTTVRVRLVKTLLTIATVSAHPSAAVAQHVSPDAPIRKVSPDLLTALGHVPGASVQGGQNGLGIVAGFGGADPSATQYQINGVSVGQSAALTVNSDLLSQVALDASNDSVGFFFLSPTPQMTFNGYAQQGAYGESLAKLTLQGTSGTIGYAFAHSLRSADSELNGQTYEDLSGLTYLHVGDVRVTGNYGSLTVPLDPWNFSFGDAVSSSIGTPISNILSSGIPSSYGPANGSSGEVSISGSFSAHELRDYDDYDTRIVGGVSIPSYQSNISSGTDASLGLGLAGELSNLSLTVDARNDRYAFSSTPAVPNVPGTSQVRSLDATTKLSRTLSHGFSLSSSIEFTQFEQQVSPSLALGAQWADNRGTSAGLTLTAGKRFIDDTSLSAGYGLADPTAAEFDCATGTIVATAPGASTAYPSSSGATLSASKRLRRVSFSVNLRERRVYDTIISAAPVAATNLPAGFLPPGYLSQVQAAYHEVGDCGGPAPDPGHILFLRNVGGASVQYADAFASATASFTPKLTLTAAYARTAAILLAENQQLLYPLSPYALNAQLPNVPLQSANLTLDYHSGRSEALVSSDLISANNQNNLPAYSRESAAFLYQLSGHLSASVAATNVTNSYVAYFVGPLYAVPLPTLGGEAFPTLAGPLTHSALYVELHYLAGGVNP